MIIVSVTSHEFFAITQKSILEKEFPLLDFIHFQTTENALKFVIDSFDSGSPIDLLITDFQTKKLDGLRFVRIIQIFQQELNWHFPILFYSIMDIPKQYNCDFNTEKIKYLTTKAPIQEFLDTVTTILNLKTIQ